MYNSSGRSDPVVFELEGFDVAPGLEPVFFLLLLLNFVLIIVGNGAVLVAVAKDRQLHRPMFVLVSNLLVADLLGATAIYPRLLMHFLYVNRPISSQDPGTRPVSFRSISHAEALAQAYTVHTYGMALHTILAAMAYDRFVAVCQPLRYHSIITQSRLFWLCFWSWVLAMVFIGILFGLHAGTKFCGTVIKHVYCSNRSILQLACEPTPANNYYGVVLLFTVSSVVFLVVVYSYAQILTVVRRGSSDQGQSRFKAVQTCISHLAVYVIYNMATIIIVISYRIPGLSSNMKKLVTILFIIVPPTVNPLVYGLVSRELRSAIYRQLCHMAPRRQHY